MSNNTKRYTPTKKDIMTTNKIIINPDNFSWTLLDYNYEDPNQNEEGGKLILKCVKTSKLIKLKEIARLNDEKLSIPNDMVMTFKIEIGNTLPNNQLFFQENVQNITKAFTELINILKND